MFRLSGATGAIGFASEPTHHHRRARPLFRRAVLGAANPIADIGTGPDFATTAMRKVFKDVRMGVIQFQDPQHGQDQEISDGKAAYPACCQTA